MGGRNQYHHPINTEGKLRYIGVKQFSTLLGTWHGNLYFLSLHSDDNFFYVAGLLVKIILVLKFSI